MSGPEKPVRTMSEPVAPTPGRGTGCSSTTLPSGGMQPKDAATTRPIYFSAEVGWQDAPVYQRDRLQAGNRVEGPCLIEEYASTTVVMPGDRVEVDGFGNLIIEVNNHG